MLTYNELTVIREALDTNDNKKLNEIFLQYSIKGCTCKLNRLIEDFYIKEKYEYEQQHTI